MEQEEKGTQLASQGRRSAVELCPQLESPSSLYSSPGWTAASGSPREGGFIDALGLSGPAQRMLGTQGISGAVSLGLGSPLKPKSLCKGCPPSATSLHFLGGSGFTEDRALLYLLPWLIPKAGLCLCEGLIHSHTEQRGSDRRVSSGEVAAVREPSQDLAAGAPVPDSPAVSPWLPFHPAEGMIPLTQLPLQGDHGQGSAARPGSSALDVSCSGRSGDKF